MNMERKAEWNELMNAMDKVWNKLSRPPEDLGDDLHYWEWTPGVGMYGVIKAHEGTQQERFGRFLTQWAKDNEEKVRFGSVNWVIPANVLHHVYRAEGTSSYLEKCRQVSDWCLHDALRTSNGGFAHVWGPGAGGIEDYKHQLWIDTLFMAGVFMLRFGVFDDNHFLIHEALKQFDIHIESQFDESCDLFYHGYHCLQKVTLGEHWGRGNGWAAVSLIELLDILQDQPYDTERFELIFKRQMERTYGLQLENGLLRTLLLDEEAYLETSASALFAYAALKGYRLGFLGEPFKLWGEAIIHELLTHHLDEEGSVLHASGGTDCQERDGYLKVPYQIRQYTNGIMLMLLTEAIGQKAGEA